MFSLLTFTFLRAASSVVESRRDCPPTPTIRYCILFSLSLLIIAIHFSFFIAFVFTRHFPDSSMHFQFHFEPSLTLVGWKGTCKCEENLCGAQFQRYTFFFEEFFPFNFLLFALIFTFLLSFGHVTHISLSSRVKNLISFSCESADPHTWKVF